MNSHYFIQIEQVSYAIRKLCNNAIHASIKPVGVLFVIECPHSVMRFYVCSVQCVFDMCTCRVDVDNHTNIIWGGAMTT